MKLHFAALAMLAVPAVFWGQAGVVDPCATAPASCATLIETHATSETRVANTAVDISVSVTAIGKDMAEVQRMLTANSNTLLAYLKAQKVERLMTSRVSFETELRDSKNGPDKIVAYKGTSSVSFRTTPEKAGDVLAGVLTNGANAIESTTFTPTEQEMADARRKLSEEATRTAVEQADAIAKAAGMHVVSLRNITVNDGMVARPMPMMRAMEMKTGAAAVPMETSAGEQSVSVNVSLTAAATK